MRSSSIVQANPRIGVAIGEYVLDISEVAQIAPALSQHQDVRREGGEGGGAGGREGGREREGGRGGEREREGRRDSVF